MDTSRRKTNTDRRSSRARSASECCTEPMRIRRTYRTWTRFTTRPARGRIRCETPAQRVIHTLANCATSDRLETVAAAVERMPEVAKATRDGKLNANIASQCFDNRKNFKPLQCRRVWIKSWNCHAVLGLQLGWKNSCHCQYAALWAGDSPRSLLVSVYAFVFHPIAMMKVLRFDLFAKIKLLIEHANSARRVFFIINAADYLLEKLSSWFIKLCRDKIFINRWFKTFKKKA